MQRAAAAARTWQRWQCSCSALSGSFSLLLLRCLCGRPGSEGSVDLQARMLVATSRVLRLPEQVRTSAAAATSRDHDVQDSCDRCEAGVQRSRCRAQAAAVDQWHADGVERCHQRQPKQQSSCLPASAAGQRATQGSSPCALVRVPTWYALGGHCRPCALILRGPHHGSIFGPRAMARERTAAKIRSAAW